MPPQRLFDFLAYARGHKCTSRRAKYTLLKEAEVKNNEPNGESRGEGDVLLTRHVLKKSLPKNNVYQVLRCECTICMANTRQTPHEQDVRLAEDIARAVEHLKLFAALACMGATFAVRILHEHDFQTIEKTLDMIPTSALRTALFQRFLGSWSEACCPHQEQHFAAQRDDSLVCLEQQFLNQLRAAAWIIRIPEFKATNRLRRFTERQNMPFINQGRILFRKRLEMDSDRARAEITREAGILEYLKDLGNPNIAEVLFAFQEESPPRFSLVFDYHPTDLRKILYPQRGDSVRFKPPNPTPERFPDSSLDSWLWIGVLGVFDAVAAVHEPQNYTQSIPSTSNEKLLGGHFDIKPANIVIDEGGRLLLTDFGQSYFKKSYSKIKADSTTNLVVKRWWTQEYDLWSLACVCIEVLAYLVDGEGAPLQFYRERMQEEPEGRSTASFWKTSPNGREVLKTCVQNRLTSYKYRRDEYLARVAVQVEKMFQIDRREPMTVKACHRELSASVRVDRYLFKNRDDNEIAGEGTYACLKDMRTSFSTERVSEMRCWIFLWANPLRNKATLTLEFAGSEGQTIVTPATTRTETDSIIPISFFDPNALFEQNRFRTNGPFLQCAFRNMHSGITFHFAKRRDFNHFYGAVTHQRIHSDYQFRIRGCYLDASSITHTRTWTAADGGGQLQIWEDLQPQHYASLYTDLQTPTITEPLSPRPSLTPDDRSSTNMSVQLRARRPSRDDVVYFRLALFFRTTAASLAIAVISINEDTFYERFDEGKACLTLERKSSSDAKKIYATLYECKLPSSSSSSPAHADAADMYPGVPLSKNVLASDIENHRGLHKGLKKVEISFWNEADLARFREYRQRLR